MFSLLHVRFEAFNTKFQVEVFWVMTPCGTVVDYMNKGATCAFETLVSYHNTTGCQNPEDLDFSPYYVIILYNFSVQFGNGNCYLPLAETSCIQRSISAYSVITVQQYTT
jgi:hypothetical protein